MGGGPGERRAGRVPRALALVGVCVSFLVWPVVGIGAEPAVRTARTVQIVFAGKGGGRYLDHTRWLREDTRLCYARRIADEMLSVRWRIVWTAPLVRTTTGYAIGRPTQREASMDGSVLGTSVRDSCDSADEEPGWSGEDVCQAALDTRSGGTVSVGRRGDGLRVGLRGPVYASPGRPCELDIRNDQLDAAVVLEPTAIAGLVAGKRITRPLGTRHPRAGIEYEPTRSCSLFPHIYDGVVYLYECDDTLIWSGAVTIAPV
jgi:hypothetical protein